MQRGNLVCALSLYWNDSGVFATYHEGLMRSGVWKRLYLGSGTSRSRPVSSELDLEWKAFYLPCDHMRQI